MKNKYKLLVICVAIFLFAIFFNTNCVLAYDNTYQAWRYDVDGDGKPDLIFRRAKVITDKEVIEEYINTRSSDYLYKSQKTDDIYKYTYTDVEKGKTYEYFSKWIYVEPKGIYKPQATEFSTVGYTFHTTKLEYTNLSDTKTGNRISGISGITTSNNFLETSKSFKEMQIFTCMPDKAINEITPIHEIVGVNMVYNSISLGTGINLSNITPKDQMVYRYAIINSNQTDLKNGVNIYIEDRVIYHEQLKELRSKLITNNVEDSSVYISDIVISEAKYDEGGYELAKTLPQFFSQYKKSGYTNEFWPKEVLGLEENPTSAVLNVFGNTLKLPATSSKSVIVRHINLGTETTVNKTNIVNGTRIASTEKAIFVKDNPEDTEWKTVVVSGGQKIQVDSAEITVEEIYNSGIEVYQDVKKDALKSEDGSYACIGHNVVIGDSWSQAFNGLNTKIENGNITEGDTVTIDGLVEESEDEYIIIDFYYTELSQNDAQNIVYVNHLFVDENNLIKKVEEQTINANNFAYTGFLYTKPLNAITVGNYNSLEDNWRVINKVQERYYRRPGQKILVQTSTSQLAERLRGEVDYKGYEVFGEYISTKELEGYKINASKDWYKPFDTILGVVLPTNAQQINFYYYKVDPKLTAEPQRYSTENLDLILSASLKGITYSGSCLENRQDNPIYSIPSGTKADISVTGLARELVSAMHIEYVEPGANTRQIDVNLEYICGKDNVKVKINDVKYSFGYYKVTDLVLDYITKITVYDANKKWTSTSGTSIFGWEDDKSELTITQAPTVEMDAYDKTTGVSTDIINIANINNWKNYVSVYVTDEEYTATKALADKYDFTSGTTSTTLTRTLMTEEEFNYVDADKNGIIDDADKTYAYDMMNKLIADKDKKEIIMNAEKRNYKNASDKYDEKLDQYNKAKNELNDYDNKDTLAGKYQSAQNAYQAKVEALNDAFDELSAARENLSELEQEKIDVENRIYYIIKTALPNKRNALSTEQSNKANKESEIETNTKNIYSAKAAYEQCSTDKKNCEDSNAECLKNEETCKGTCYGTYSACVDAYNNCLDNYCSSTDNCTVCSYNCTSNYNTCKDNCSSCLKTCKRCSDESIKYNNYISKGTTLANELNEIAQKISGLNSDINSLEAELESLNARLDELPVKINDAYKDIHTLLSDTIPIVASNIMPAEQDLIAAKKAYDDYEANEFKKATLAKEEAEQQKNKAEETYNKAVSEYKSALAKAENYVSYYNAVFVDSNDITLPSGTTMEIKDDYTTIFDTAKYYYDTFWAIKSETPKILNTANIFDKDKQKSFAEKMGLELVIKVYNTRVRVNDEVLNNQERTDLISHSNALYSYAQNDFGVRYEGKLSHMIYNTPVVEAPKIQFRKEIYNKVTTTEHNIAAQLIRPEILNGIRTLAVEAVYTAKSYFSHLDNHRLVEDNVYYSDYVDEISKDSNGNIISGIFRLDRDGLQSSKTKKVNIYTPITASATLKSNKDTIVDQSKEAISNKTNIQAIQLSVPFTIKLENNVKEKVYVKTTNDFCKGYYIKFNFDVHNVKLNGDLYQKGARVKAGTWIGLIDKNFSGDTTVEATPYSNVQDVTIDIADEEISSYVVRAIAHNATKSMMSESTKYSTVLDMMDYRNSINEMVENICTNVSTTYEAKNRPSYFADTTYSVVLLNRLYDFRVTDIKDISWKSVFRETQGSAVNAHTGIAYYTGTRKWVLGNEGANKTVERTPSEIGSSPQRILPVGTYKNTDKTYVKAPKLGYGFSFDLKLTGNYYKGSNINTEKYVSIKTKFYYISKNGTDLLLEYKPGSNEKGIYLFYKNAAGKYVRIDENGGGYDLSFVPNDGYRLIEDKERITLSKNKLSLGNLRNLKLTYQMATVDQTYSTSLATDNGNVITYYGEYKLPNSTIAVEVDANGKYDINKPLKNGYIGVIFDITAMSGKVTTENGVEQPITLSYSQNSKYDETTGEYLPNTSQWDYEGYLGFRDVGKNTLSQSSKIKLEGSDWIINSNDTYNKIKGTVIMYDLDEKAATDYE